MIRKTILSALAVAMIAGAVPANASDYGVEVPPVGHGSKYDRDAAIAGAVFGLIGAIAGAKGGHRGYHKARRHCFEKPIKRYDPYYGHRVIVGYKTVCR